MLLLPLVSVLTVASLLLTIALLLAGPLPTLVLRPLAAVPLLSLKLLDTRRGLLLLLAAR